MKKTLIFLSVAVFIFTIFSSCGTNTPTVAEPTPNATQTAVAQQTAAAQQTAVAQQTTVAQQTAVAQQTVAAQQTAVAQQTTVAGLSYNSLVSVPGGTFTQTNGSESFSHTISAFKMGQYEVTYELWYTVRQWAITNGYAFANPGKIGRASCRVRVC